MTTMTTMKSEKLKVVNLTKLYPGVVALDHVSIGFRSGEVHAIVGENGAGKSTLIKCISGAIRPEEGEIIIDGRSNTQLTPKLSKELGVEVIYQELSLFRTMNVMENIFMSEIPGKPYAVNFAEMRRNTEAIFREMGVEISPTALISELSNAQMQLVEIAKAISHDARILIMDEPTAPLTNAEVDILFSIVNRLKEKGVCIIYISHRLNEIFEISDRVTVMRDGTVVTTLNTADTNREKLIALMVGRPLSESFTGHTCAPGDVILEARNLRAPKVHDVSFQIRRGEILGIGGLVGSGRTETMRLLFGADRKQSGSILLNGEEIEITHPEDALKYGIALCPEDRKSEGVLLNMDIGVNITLPIVRRICRFMTINRKKESAIIDQYKDALRIKTPSIHQLVRNLSGGNQQKVVISKWLASEADVLIFDEPTQGIDVGAKNEIYQLIFSLADAGKAIVMVSSDMEELIGMSDRILVMCEGELTGELQRGEFTQEKILSLASGNV